MLFLTHPEGGVKIRSELRAQTIKELLEAKFGMKRNRAHISRRLRKLTREGVLQKAVDTRQQPGTLYVEQSSYYCLADFKKAFDGIKADRQEIHRLRDTLRHQKIRKNKKE